MKTPRKRGFTLVELMVVIAIIGILVSLLMPAVQQAREAGRRMSCQNNLKQVVLALHQHLEQRSSFPASGLDNTSKANFDPQAGRNLSWIVQILPFIEQENLYNAFDLKRTAFDQPNEPQEKTLPSMLCPSDSAGGRFFVDAMLTQGKRFAKSNYAAYVSPVHVESQGEFPGALIGHRNQRPADFTDGMTNVIMLAEVRVRPQEHDQRGVWVLPWTGASLLAYDMHYPLPPPKRFVHDPASLVVNQPPNNQGPNFDMLYACPDPVVAQQMKMPCDLWTPGGAKEYLSAAPRSRHPGGVNAAFAGGHVAFLPNTIDKIAMAYLVSVNDGQAISPSAYLP